jgi:segregation and condensation protein A
MVAIAVSDGRLKLDLFEGPLDLLLYLIRKHEVDVHDIPIVEVTQQYQEMLDEARREGLLDLDFAGDYFLMAATLIQIKSRMLLPRDEDADGESAEDPRRELVQQLLEYERFKEAAMLLQERGELTATMHPRPAAALKADHDIEDVLEVDLLALAKAFRQVMEEKRLRTPHVFAPSRYTVGGRIRHLLGGLSETEPRSFAGLFEEGTIEECVVTFLALLELAKRGFLRCWQEPGEDEIRLALVPESERPDSSLADAASEFDVPPLELGDGVAEPESMAEVEVDEAAESEPESEPASPAADEASGEGGDETEDEPQAADEQRGED